MSASSGPYDTLKSRAYWATATASGSPNRDAQLHGASDVYAVVMSDSNHSRQPAFLAFLGDIISDEALRRILLDGLAREYAGCDSWMAYVDRESDDA